MVFVYIGFIRIGIWEQIHDEDPRAILHFAFFQVVCFLIFWTHFKCMTTQPGILSPSIQTLRYSKLPQKIRELIYQVGARAKLLEEVINNKKKHSVEMVHKSELSKLN